MITTKQKLDEITRELNMRRKLYPRWVDAGKMPREQAVRHILLMQAIRQDYLDKLEQEAPELPL